MKNIALFGIDARDGKQALAYSRIRYASDGDYKRTERQRTVVNAIFNKLQNTNISKYPEAISEFMLLVKTNMYSWDMIKLGKDFSGLISNGLVQD